MEDSKTSSILSTLGSLIIPLLRPGSTAFCIVTAPTSRTLVFRFSLDPPESSHLSELHSWQTINRGGKTLRVLLTDSCNY